MECREFREYTVDKPRGGSRTEALDNAWRAHAAECKACAAWLADEKNLAASFDLLRQQDEGLQVPANLATALFEEFRNLNPAKPIVVPIRGSRRSWWLGAAAAAALAVTGWFGLGERQPADPPQDSIALVAPDAVAPDAVVPDATAPAREAAPPADQPPATPSVTAETREQPPPDAAYPEIGPLATDVAPDPAETAQIVRPPSEPAPAAVIEGNREVVTEFVPLTYARSASPAPGSRLLRVRLPSTALTYFGLPGAAASSSVEADVLLGEDGLAYAVRFVRPVMASLSAPDPTASRTLEP